MLVLLGGNGTKLSFRNVNNDLVQGALVGVAGVVSEVIAADESLRVTSTHNTARYHPLHNRYSGDVRRVLDASRLAMVFSTPQSLQRTLHALDHHLSVIKVENRFRSPTPLGWRDFTIIIEVEIEPGVSHLVELQLQLR